MTGLKMIWLMTCVMLLPLEDCGTGFTPISLNFRFSNAYKIVHEIRFLDIFVISYIFEIDTTVMLQPKKCFAYGAT